MFFPKEDLHVHCVHESALNALIRWIIAIVIVSVFGVLTWLTCALFVYVFDIDFTTSSLVCINSAAVDMPACYDKEFSLLFQPSFIALTFLIPLIAVMIIWHYEKYKLKKLEKLEKATSDD